MKIKIYLSVIALLAGFLVYALFFMKSDFIEGDNLMTAARKDKENSDIYQLEYAKSQYKPKQIPEDVLKGSEENDFYSYLFLDKNRNVILYMYKPGSKDPKNSEDYHKQIEAYLAKVLVDGNYKNRYVSDVGVTTYEKNLLAGVKAYTFVPDTTTSPKELKNIEAKKARIEAVKTFVKECSQTICIINNRTNEYVITDKRDLDTAKKVLKEYRNW